MTIVAYWRKNWAVSDRGQELGAIVLRAEDAGMVPVEVVVVHDVPRPFGISEGAVYADGMSGWVWIREEYPSAFIDAHTRLQGLKAPKPPAPPANPMADVVARIEATLTLVGRRVDHATIGTALERLRDDLQESARG